MSKCVHAHASPSTLAPLTPITLPYLWVPARGSSRSPHGATISKNADEGVHPVSGHTAEVARRSGAKRWSGVITRPRGGRGSWMRSAHMRTKARGFGRGRSRPCCARTHAKWASYRRGVVPMSDPLLSELKPLSLAVCRAFKTSLKARQTCTREGWRDVWWFDG